MLKLAWYYKIILLAALLLLAAAFLLPACSSTYTLKGDSRPCIIASRDSVTPISKRKRAAFLIL